MVVARGVSRGAAGLGLARYASGWADVALDQYLALPAEEQALVDARLAELLDEPNGPHSMCDPVTDHWTTTAAYGSVLMVYVFRVGLPRLVVLRLVY